MITQNLSYSSYIGNVPLNYTKKSNQCSEPQPINTNKKKTVQKALAYSAAVPLVALGILAFKGKLSGIKKLLCKNANVNKNCQAILNDNISIQQAKNICSKEEYCSTLEKLLGFEKRYISSGGIIQNTKEGNVFYRYDSQAYRNVPEELKGLLPYCGEADISADINMFLKYNQNGKLGTVKEGTLVYSKEFLNGNKELLHLDSDSANDFVKCLDYSLEQLDKRYGTYNGFVYRGGLFDGNARQFYSTSSQLNPVQVRCQRGNDYQFHLIKTTNGHKIKDFQAEFNPNNKLFSMESEILLPRNTKYTEVTNSGKYETGRRAMAEKLYEMSFKDTEMTLEDIISKIHVWE